MPKQRAQGRSPDFGTMGQGTEQGYANMSPNRNELLEAAKDKTRTAVDRGKAVVELCKTGMTQAKIAELTHLSVVSISHLKTTSDNLEERVRKMCEGHQLTEGAYYSLATAVGLDQSSVFRHAVDISTKRDNERLIQKIGFKGRQSPRGLITDEDMKEAKQTKTKRNLA